MSNSNNTSYLLVTPKWNWDSANKRAMDQDHVAKKVLTWGTKITVVPNGMDSSKSIEIDVENLDKDTHDIIIADGHGNNEIHKVVNVVNRADGSSTPKYKTMSEDDVKTVAEELMKNGNTSSLAVKEELRKQGYWAQQQQVSDHLQTIQKKHSDTWDVYFNGRFNEYSLSDDDGSGAPTSTTQSTHAPSATATTTQKKKRVRKPAQQIDALIQGNFSGAPDPAQAAKDFIKDAIDNKKFNTQNFLNTDNLWVVYRPTTKDVAIYEDSFTSDDVRNAYRKVLGTNVRIQVTRARRYKHMKHWKF